MPTLFCENVCFMRRVKIHSIVLLAFLCYFFISINYISSIKAEFIVSPTEWFSNNNFLTNLLSTQINQGSQSLNDTFYSAPPWDNSAAGNLKTSASLSAMIFSNSAQNIWPQNSRLDFPWTYNYNSFLTYGQQNQITPFTSPHHLSKN